MSLDTDRSELHIRLKNILIRAHFKCCMRPNSSSLVLMQTYYGSGSVTHSISAAINTFGDMHAPVDKAIILFTKDRWKEILDQNLKAGNIIPGWGSQQVEGKPDPIFDDLARELVHYEAAMEVISHTTKTLHEAGKKVYPNAAAYTAAVGSILGYTEKDIHFLLLECRLPAWRQTVLEYARSGSIMFQGKTETTEGEE